jgi:ATP-binding cassette, subfamily B, bacterial PglK
MPRLKVEREIRLDRITFIYPNAEDPAVSDVSVTIPAKGSVGIVGRTGAGKTTILDLILGLLEPTTGSLLVDGTPVSKERRPCWQRNLGYVPQNLYLADDTIAANIAFGLPHDRIDMGAVEAAARIAHIHEFVTRLPAGYATLVGDRGVRLSGGQRQRIAIARALYHDPDVLVFDEATSALDGGTERAIIDAVNRLARRKTIVIVAHRMKTVQNCDTIYCLEGGRVVGCGTFADLVEGNTVIGKAAGISSPLSS